MEGLTIALGASAFVAGFLMFLAPCTLPLVPAYIAFISGVKEQDARSRASARRKIRRNALMFVFGFSLIFISFGVLAGFFGSFIGPYRSILSQIGGAFIILFGFMMLGALNFAPLQREYTVSLPKSIKPGERFSAFLMGSIFALGWTPCIGPVLATVLLLASTSATVVSGGLLLGIFSLGLAIPFLLTALLYAHIRTYIQMSSRVSQAISIVGGIFLIVIGVFMLLGNFGLTVEYGYQLLETVGIGNLLDYY